MHFRQPPFDSLIAITILYFVSIFYICLTPLSTWYRLNHTYLPIFILLTSFSIISLRFYVVACVNISMLYIKNEWYSYIYYVYTHTHTSLSIHLSTNIWAFSTSWLLWLMPLWTLVNKHLFEFLFSLPLGSICRNIYMYNWLINSMFNFYEELAILFSTMAAPFQLPTNRP